MKGAKKACRPGRFLEIQASDETDFSGLLLLQIAYFRGATVRTDKGTIVVPLTACNGPPSETQGCSYSANLHE